MSLKLSARVEFNSDKNKIKEVRDARPRSCSECRGKLTRPDFGRPNATWSTEPHNRVWYVKCEKCKLTWLTPNSMVPKYVCYREDGTTLTLATLIAVGDAGVSKQEGKQEDKLERLGFVKSLELMKERGMMKSDIDRELEEWFVIRGN